MTSRRAALVCLASLALLAGPAAAEREGDEAGVLLGRVSHAESPLATAVVFAYELADQSIRQATTDGQGNFLFSALPAGLFKIIAFKPGFLPAVVLLTRAKAEASQFLRVELAQEAPRPVAAGEGEADFWSLRRQIPGDVLRRIELAVEEAAAPLPTPAQAARFAASMRAMSGIREDSPVGASQLTSGQLDLRGSLRAVELGLTGNFVELAPTTTQPAGLDSAGKARMLALRLEHGDDTQLSLSSVDNRLFTPRPESFDTVDMEVYGLNWSQALGASGRSELAARYVEESNYFVSGPIRPLRAPQASRLWHLEGSYRTAVGDRATVDAGLRYRTRQYDTPAAGTALPEQRVDVFGNAGMQIRPALLVEYGLYSTLSDGSLFFAPRGEMVFRLAPRWKVAGGGSYRFDGGAAEEIDDFFLKLYSELDACEQVEAYCYELTISHDLGDGHELSLGVSQRKFAETLRVQFSDDFFDYLEGLYLVRGDTLPEVELGFTRRWSPWAVSRFESNLASGGGGMVRGRSRRSFENTVAYMVTSVDTRFENTSTGVFVAFHRLEQRLEPIHGRRSGPAMERERLQLLLTQDLDVLSRMASNLAVQFNMELTRGTGATPSGDEDAIQKRVMGGIAVTF